MLFSRKGKDHAIDLRIDSHDLTVRAAHVVNWRVTLDADGHAPPGELLLKTPPHFEQTR